MKDYNRRYDDSDSSYQLCYYDGAHDVIVTAMITWIITVVLEMTPIIILIIMKFIMSNNAKGKYFDRLILATKMVITLKTL